MLGKFVNVTLNNKHCNLKTDRKTLLENRLVSNLGLRIYNKFRLNVPKSLHAAKKLSIFKFSSVFVLNILDIYNWVSLIIHIPLY